MSEEEERIYIYIYMYIYSVLLRANQVAPSISEPVDYLYTQLYFKADAITHLREAVRRHVQ